MVVFEAHITQIIFSFTEEIKVVVSYNHFILITRST